MTVFVPVRFSRMRWTRGGGKSLGFSDGFCERKSEGSKSGALEEKEGEGLRMRIQCGMQRWESSRIRLCK